MKKMVELPPDLEEAIDKLISETVFPSFQVAVEELIRLGIVSLSGKRPRDMPPGSVPAPERPVAPDPTKDILKM